uniref:Uncharacterized protein n=1 Tax=Alexandrium monilatum TaxID=311494 RepID=A0A7S4RY28_9DINO
MQAREAGLRGVVCSDSGGARRRSSSSSIHDGRVLRSYGERSGGRRDPTSSRPWSHNGLAHSASTPQAPPTPYLGYEKIDFDKYREAYAAYSNEQDFIRAVLARRAEAGKNEPWGSRVWKGMCGMAGSVKAQMPRRASRSLGRVAPVHGLL